MPKDLFKTVFTVDILFLKVISLHCEAVMTTDTDSESNLTAELVLSDGTWLVGCLPALTSNNCSIVVFTGC